MPRKGRARRFREARQLKQGLADRSIEDLLDSSNWETVSEEKFEDEYDEDDEDDDDDDEYDDDEDDEEDAAGWPPPPPPPLPGV